MSNGVNLNFMQDLTDQNFEQEIRNAEKPVLVDFMAIWCPPCLALSPVLEKLEKEFEGKIIFAKVNVDVAPKISQKYEINPIPTVILFKEGKPTNRFFGVKSEEAIREWLEENLKNNENKIEELMREYEKYAKENRFKLNPNRKVAERIVKGLFENEKKYGVRYCPCRRISGNLEEDKKIICPCISHRQEIEIDGHCHCGLFVKMV